VFIKRPKIVVLDFLSCPRGRAEELETRVHRWLFYETPDIDLARQPRPTIFRLEFLYYHLERDAMERVVWLRGDWFHTTTITE
jgi:hypothetical protein